MNTERKRDWVTVGLLVLAVKLTLIVWGIASFSFENDPQETWLSIWHRWDVRHFERIASWGYWPDGLPQLDHEFLSQIPPGFPALMALLTAAGWPLQTSGFALSLFFSFAAAILLFELVRFEARERAIAFRAVAYLNVFPSAYFLLAPYSEAQFLFFSLLTFYLMRVERRPSAACVSAALAILTRWIGVTLLPAIVVQMILLRRAGLIGRRSFIALLIPLAAVGVFFCINQFFFGSPFAFREHAMRNPSIVRLDSFPYSNLLTDVRKLIESPDGKLDDLLFMIAVGWPTIFLAVATIAFGAVARKLPLPYAVYGASYILFVASLSWAVSTIRFLLMLFPLFLGLAKLRSRFFFAATVLVFAGFLLYFSRLFVQGGCAY